MKAILLAAGYATRLYPLTRERPKPLLEVGGRPLLDHLLDRVLPLDGLTGIIVVHNHRFAEPFRAWCDALEVPVGVTVTLVDDGSTSDDDKLGAVGDLALALRHLPDSEEVVVVGGDNLLGFELDGYRRELLERRRPLLVVREVAATAQGQYNSAVIEADGRVSDFEEKAAHPKSDQAAICLYFFPPGVRRWVDAYLETREAAGPASERDAPGYFIEWLVTQTEVHALPIAGDWYDIGSLETLEEARRRYDGGGGGPVLRPDNSLCFGRQ